MEQYDKIAFREELKNRTKRFAVQCVKFYQSLPNSGESWVIGKQFIRSATSIAANYRAACRARSGNEFFSKICIVVEETDETMFWLEMLDETGIVATEKISPIYDECEEILKIMVTTRKNSDPKK
ncbi:MAG: four helix bundle protein [Salinivirgaceae bacterium]|nr:four helix bundle protein [Salinivirgaceae bacterium]